MAKPAKYKCSIVPKEVFDDAQIVAMSAMCTEDALRGKPYIVLLNAKDTEEQVITCFKGMALHASNLYEQGHWAEWEMVGTNALFIRVRN